MGDQDTLRGVMIGAGYFGGVQMEAWPRVKGAEIVAVCDIDEAKLGDFAARFGVPAVYTDPAQALGNEKPDFVDIATRPDSHRQLAALAAERGIDVLCQKPLATDYAEAEELVEACERHGVRLMVNENWRWQPWFREIRSLIDAGNLGEPFYARFTIRRGDGRGDHPFPRQPYFKDMPRLLLYESTVHYVDTSRYLWGEIAAIHSLHRRLNPNLIGEDFTLTTLTMSNGMTVLIDANRFSGAPTAEPVCFGSLTLEGAEGQLHLGLDASIRVEPIDGAPYTHHYDLPEVGYFGDSCHATQQHFVDCLLSGDEFETGGRDYLETTFRAVFAGYESAEAGDTVAL
jgi:predicted dehydrogenase